MNSIRVCFAFGLALVLAACGSDSSKGGSDKGFTGNKSDVRAAKSLVAEYDANYGRIFFDKGYVDRSKVINNLNSALTFLTYAANYNVQPSSYWAMRHIGCLLSDGTTQFTQNDQHTQMDLLVGEKSNRAMYIQQNIIDRCYLGQVGFNSQFTVNGQLQSYVDRTRGILPLPRNVCRDLKVDHAFVRIDKEEFKHDNYNSNDNYRNQPYTNQPYTTSVNYNRHRYVWTPDQDYYYEVSNNRYAQFNYSTQAGISEEDSFAKIGNSEALFISKSIRTRSSGYGCQKDVYWGFEIDPNNPPGIQILGRNSTSL